MKKRKSILKRFLQATVEGTKDVAEVLTGLAKNIVKDRSRYSTPEDKRQQLRKMYEAETSDGKGETLTKSIVNGLTAWVAGNGVNFTLKNVKKEVDSGLRTNIESFFQYNKLYSNKLHTIVKEGFLADEALLVLQKVRHAIFDEEYVKIRWIDKDLYKYEVGYDENDPDLPVEVKWKLKDDKEYTVFRAGEFVLIQFGKNPRIANAIPILERLDEIRSKFADSNDLFGTPAPVFTVKDFDTAVRFRYSFKSPESEGNSKYDNTWEAGNLVIVPGDGKFLEPSGDGAESFKKEFEMNVQMGSGATGFPIHLLGFVSMLGTKAGSDSILEQIHTATMELRQIFKETLFDLSVLQAKMMGFKIEEIRKAEIIISLPLNTQYQLMMLSTYYLPMYKEGLLDLDSFVEMIPNVDPEVVKERLQEEKEKKSKSDREETANAVKNFVTNTQDQKQTNQAAA